MNDRLCPNCSEERQQDIERLRRKIAQARKMLLARRDESYKTDQYRGVDADGMARIYDSTRDESTHAHSGKGPKGQE